MRMLGILDREIMQMELRSGREAAARGRARAGRSRRHGRAPGPFAGFLDRNVGDTPAGSIDAGSDHARLGGSVGRDVSRQFHTCLPSAAGIRAAAPGYASALRSPRRAVAARGSARGCEAGQQRELAVSFH